MSTTILYSSYPKFHMAVDCVIFIYDENQLKLLLYPRNFEPLLGDWSLMGGFIEEEESMEDAARRVLLQTVGLENIFLEQVQGFSDPNRDPGGRVISMAFYALIRSDEHNHELVREHRGSWWPITQLPPLILDHRTMVTKALERLQHKASHELIGKDLLPEIFTLTQLNNLYNAIFQRNFDAGNFRKKIASLGVLEQTPYKETQSSKKGAFYYKYPDNFSPVDFDRIVKF
jgi:8-oxo-dGTP diphosphatase